MIWFVKEPILIVVWCQGVGDTSANSTTGSVSIVDVSNTGVCFFCVSLCHVIQRQKLLSSP